MICPHCQQEHPDFAVFCPNTGLEIILDQVFCPACGSEVTTDLKYCGFCGQSLSSEQVDPSQTVPVPPQSDSEPDQTIHLPAQEDSNAAATIPALPLTASELLPTGLRPPREDSGLAATVPLPPQTFLKPPPTIPFLSQAVTTQPHKIRNRVVLFVSFLIVGMVLMLAGVYLIFFNQPGWLREWGMVRSQDERVSQVESTSIDEISLASTPASVEATLPLKLTETPVAVIKDTPMPSPAIIVTITPTATPTTTMTPTATSNQPLALQVNPIDGAEIVWVPQGEFLMGSDSSIDPFFYGSEGPQHMVTLDEFWVYRTEVTNAMYQQCVAAQACPRPIYNTSNTRSDYYGNPDYDDYPVVYVSWRHAAAYCVWAGGRLPTEAEWEKAGRGTDGRLFPWGNNNPTNQLAQYNASDTTMVGSYPQGASPYGLFDMAGNVIEWVFDRFQATYYSLSPDENPIGPASGSTRVYRGGAYHNPVAAIRVVMRGSRAEDHANVDIGFRCVVELP